MHGRNRLKTLVTHRSIMSRSKPETILRRYPLPGTKPFRTASPESCQRSYPKNHLKSQPKANENFLAGPRGVEAARNGSGLARAVRNETLARKNALCPHQRVLVGTAMEI